MVVSGVRKKIRGARWKTNSPRLIFFVTCTSHIIDLWVKTNGYNAILKDNGTDHFHPMQQKKLHITYQYATESHWLLLLFCIKSHFKSKNV